MSFLFCTVLNELIKIDFNFIIRGLDKGDVLNER